MADARQSGTPTQSGFRADIEGLRAVAVALVVVCHAGLGLPGGYVGVDVFFVISGFLITRLLANDAVSGTPSVTRFYLRRLRRLAPALAVVLVAVTAWATWRMIWIDLEPYGASLISSVFLSANLHFFAIATDYFGAETHTQPLLHLWSLGVEEQFYLFAPVLIWSALRWGGTARAFQVVLALTVLGAIFAVGTSRHWSDAAFYLLPWRAQELGLGACLALGRRLRVGRKVAGAAGLAGLAAIMLPALLAEEGSWRILWVTLAVVGTALLIAVGGRGGVVDRVLGSGPMRAIGGLSYPLYLWHWPVLIAGMYESDGALEPALALACVASALLLAWATWGLIERPIRQGRLLRSWPALVGTFLVIALGLAAVGCALVLSGGLPRRHPEAMVTQLETALRQGPPSACHGVDVARLRSGDLCVLGSTGPIKFALVGDSHADALSLGFRAAASERGLAGVQITGPGFLPTTGRRSSGMAAPDRTTEALIAYLEARPDIGLIYITNFWLRSTTGTTYRDPARVFTDDAYDGSGAAYNDRALANGLSRLFDALPDRQFIILDDVPSGRELDPRRHARRRLLGKSSSLGLPRATADSQRRAYEPALTRIDERHDNVRYAPVMALLCGVDVCPLFAADGIALFRDGDHLSPAGAERLAPALTPLLAPLEERRP